MNKKTLTIALLFITQLCISQVFDDEVKKVIKTISQQLDSKGGKLNIAIYPFKYKKENEGILAEYITEEFWDKMPNMGNSFSLMDRSTFEEYYQEHNLKTEGLIDPSTEKQFGMLIAADAYVTGKTYVFNSVINLRVKVTNTQTGKILATGSSKLPITFDMAESMGLKGWKNKLKEAEKGKSSNPYCATENVGDICFENKSNYNRHILIKNLGKVQKTSRRITVSPGKYGCFKDLPAQGFYYTVSSSSFMTIDPNNHRSGNVYVKKCQSDIIKL